MSSNYNNTISTLKIYIIGGEDDILNKIFPKEIQNNSLYKKRILEDNSKEKIKDIIYWEAFIYPNLTKENLDNIFNSLIEQLNITNLDEKNEIIDDWEIVDFNELKGLKFDQKNVTIKFGKEN